MSGGLKLRPSWNTSESVNEVEVWRYIVLSQWNRGSLMLEHTLKQTKKIIHATGCVKSFYCGSKFSWGLLDLNSIHNLIQVQDPFLWSSFRSIRWYNLKRYQNSSAVNPHLAIVFIWFRMCALTSNRQEKLLLRAGPVTTFPFFGPSVEHT